MEALVALGVGGHTGSVAMIAFSLVSGADLVGVLAGRVSGAGNTSESSDSLTSRFLSLGALAAGSYILLRSTYAILTEARPTSSLLGEAVVECSIALTVVVFWAARRGLPPFHFDPMAALRWAFVRLLLAMSTLAGLVLNATLDLWMADPLSALPATGFFFYKGKRLLQNEREVLAERTPLSEAGKLLASVVEYVGANHTGQDDELHIIVCGGTELGMQTARTLTEEGHDVTIIEVDLEHCRTLKEKHTGAVVFGDATDPGVLHEAGVAECDVVAALGKSAKTNTRICQAAEREAAVRTVMRAPFAEAPVERKDTGELARACQLGQLDGDLRILELHVAPQAPIAGQRLSDIQLPPGGRVLSTTAGDSVEEEAAFAPGERYVVVASEKAIPAMICLFRGSFHRKRSS